MTAVSWKSAVSANWATAADWSAGAAPAAVNSITLSDTAATLAIAAPGVTEAITAGFTSGGTVEVDATGAGGTSVTIGATLSNSGVLAIGNSGISKATTVTAKTLANTGTIDLTGGSAAATLDITGASPASLTGDYVLRGDALVNFSSGGVSPSGGVTSIAGDSELVLDGTQSRVELSGAAGNSGLTGLTSNAGTLAVQLGSKIATGGAFTNNGLIEVDNDIFGTGDAGGSGLTFGGALTNNGDLDIGNSGLTIATTVTAAALSNAAMGTVNLTGGTAQATLDIAGAAPSTLTGFYYLQGDTLLEFGSGHITAIAANSELSIGGPGARVALSSATTSNSALTALASNSGILDLGDTSLTTTTAFANHNQLSVDGGTLNLGGALTNTGNFSIDDSSPTIGGALTNSGDLSIDDGNLTIHGGLTNSGSIQINAGSSAIQVTASALSNTGTIDLSGGAGRATLDISAAAPATLTGSLGLSGNALMEFASGGITTIATGASLALDGPRARVALSSNTTISGALTGLSKNLGAFDLADGAAVAITTALTNSGTLYLNSLFYGSDFSDDGGSTLTIGGVLTNTAQINIGNSEILAPTAVTAASLANTGTIDLTGSGAVRASLDSAAAAPATWTGTANLSGDALLEFHSGGITAIASGADLSLNGADALVALSTALTTNSALTGLATNAGTLNLSDSPFTTTVALNNTGTLEVDYSYYGTAGGGSAVAIGGTLTNSGFVEIGNTGITKATTVTAKGLANTGTIDLTGGAATRATFDSTAAAPATWTGSAILSGDAVLEFASGGITAIGSGAELSLNGALSWVALSTALTGNSALTKLASNVRTFVADGGSALTTTGGFTNTGTLDLDTIGNGGSHLAVGGTLTNMGLVDIGDYAITAAATLTAKGLANSGTIYLTGGTTTQAKLSVTGAASNTDYIDISNGALSTTTGLTNSGSLYVDEFGAGGSTLTVGATLTNSSGGALDIGNTAITKAITVTAAGLANTGTIDLTGSAAIKATLDIAAAAPATWTGIAILSGDALLEFASGRITAIGSDADLTLNGAGALAALSTALTTDSALTGLANNNGTLDLENGASLTTTTGLTNTGSVAVDYFGSTGGSSLTIGGTLTNQGSLYVGNSAIAKATTVTAAALSNAGTVDLASGTAAATLKVTGAFGNTDLVEVDSGYQETGGSILTIGGTLTNSATFEVGNTGITKATTVTAAGLANTGTIDLTGATTIKATLDITAAAQATLAGNYSLSGDALLEFASGGITAIGTGADLTLNGASALVALSTALTTDSALTGLASNAGTFSLENGASLTTTVGLTNSGTVEVDYFGSNGGSSLTVGGALTNNSFDNIYIGNSSITKATTVTAGSVANAGDIDLTSGTAAATLKVTGAFGNTDLVEVDSGFDETGGSILTIGGTLTNSATFEIGNTGLSKATTVTAAGLANTGTIDLTGAAAIKATLDITTAAPATLGGTYDLSGDALLEFASGGITAIGSGANLTLNGASALVALSTALTTDSALTGLASNAGTLALENGASLTTTVGLANNGTVEVDYFGSNGGSSLTVGGTLTNNSFSFDIGNTGLTTATKVTLAALTNNDSISISGGSGADTGTLSLTGASSDAGSITVNTGGVLALSNTLTVSGSLILDGGTVSGGTLATSGSGVIETGFDQSGTLSSVTIASGSTFTAEFDSTLTVKGVTVDGSLYGSGSATLDFAGTGTDSLTNVSGFTTIGLANGAANTLTLATANFTGTAGVITVNDGNSGNTVSGSTLTSADSITVHAGSRADVLTGGAGNDVFYAGGDTTMTGGAGTNQFIFSAPPTLSTVSNTIADFAASSTNGLVFSNSGFSLGLTGGTTTPQALTSTEAATLFTANSTGAFANTSQRLAYDTTNGELFSSTDGSGGASHHVATLTGEPSINTGNQLFFIS